VPRYCLFAPIELLVYSAGSVARNGIALMIVKKKYELREFWKALILSAL
jgi:hypothetical protein